MHSPIEYSWWHGNADWAFLLALWRSPTAWDEIGLRLALVSVLVLAFTLVIVRPGALGRLAPLHRDRSGAASVAGFALVSPILLALILIFAQLIMLLNKAMLVHYAAYCAARSARVWIWDFDPNDPLLRLGGRLVLNPVVMSRERPEVRRKVEEAARFALITAAPVSGNANGGAGGDIPERVLRILAESAGLAGRAQVLRRQAGYAFDPANSRIAFALVSVAERPDMVWDLAQPGDAWPVQASVDFRVRLDLPVVRFFGDAGGDGAWYTGIHAEMVLL